MRNWSNSGNDSGSVHCLGNGLLCVYGIGPNILQLFGPPYSAPTMFGLELMADAPAQSQSSREPGTAVWRHRVSIGGAPAAELLDFVPPDAPFFIRRIDCSTEITFALRLPKGVTVVANRSRFPGAGAALLAWAEAGSPIYGNYLTQARQYGQLLFTGPATCRQGTDGFLVTVPRGKCDILYAAGPSYPEAVGNAERLMAADPDALLGDARRWWQEFAGRRKAFGALIPDQFPQKERLLELIDSVSVLIRAQQGREGGVLAGHNYHLGYVRDQYGVFRCLLALGYREEARAILAFYWDVWRKHGRIHNAQGIGADVFHIHENDEVEITGYLVLQAFDYLRETGDEDFVRQITPMLSWAFRLQKTLLADGMLPFNGDETYIAGGLLPRDCINDGSAEATLLFLTGGRQLLDWVGENDLWEPAELREAARLLDDVQGRFAGNFARDGALITNNPDRLGACEPPRFRHGVCQACGAFGWTERADGGLYVCPGCLQHPQSRVIEHKVHMLKSVTLMPAYVGSSVVSPNCLDAALNDILRDYARTGRLPSSPEEDGTVGYDYGLLLYNLALRGHPMAADILEKMLSAADDTDAWVEYYKNGAPTGTRCRPWESGINLHAAVNYALSWAPAPDAAAAYFA